MVPICIGHYSEKPDSTQYFLVCLASKPSEIPAFTSFILQTCIYSWSYCNLIWNKLMHILMGNRRLGYNIAVWNCQKGLLHSDQSPSEKLTDIKSLLNQHDLHLLGVVESDLHGLVSRVRRINPVSTSDILHKLHVDGYSIKLPASWKSHGQARIILHVRDDV